MEAKGLVTREIDQTDSRAKMITTTSGGAQLAQRALTAVQAVDRDFVQTVPDQPALLFGAAPPRRRRPAD